MKNIFMKQNFNYILFFCVFAISCSQKEIIVSDTDGVLGKSNAPATIEIKLNEAQLIALDAGSLVLEKKSGEIIPVQKETSAEGHKTKLVFIMPEGDADTRTFKLHEIESPVDALMTTTLDKNTGQLLIQENDKKVLQYNYQTVFEKDVVRPQSKIDTELSFGKVGGIYRDKYLKAHPKTSKDTVVTGSIYSIPRSDYIHPLYGLEEEMLSSDWPDGGHPHHRAIFWAWPEVEYGSQLGDIYALQRVFARPTGNIEYTSGTVFSEISAENLWMWEDKEGIVREQAIIRAYKSNSKTRIIDLTIKLDALKDSVTIATRNTDSYGGLNIRMQHPEKQDISFFTDEAEKSPRRAWSDFNGVFEGNNSTSGMMILQHQNNPEYPGDWQDYPGLHWVQPTFPTKNTRYELSKEESLILRFRLIVHAGGKPSIDTSENNWDAYHATNASIYRFQEDNK